MSRGGRRRWAHLTLTRMNVRPIILQNQIEDNLETAIAWRRDDASPALAEFPRRGSTRADSTGGQPQRLKSDARAR